MGEAEGEAYNHGPVRESLVRWQLKESLARRQIEVFPDRGVQLPR